MYLCIKTEVKIEDRIVETSWLESTYEVSQRKQVLRFSLVEDEMQNNLPVSSLRITLVNVLVLCSTSTITVRENNDKL